MKWEELETQAQKGVRWKGSVNGLCPTGSENQVLTNVESYLPSILRRLSSYRRRQPPVGLQGAGRFDTPHSCARPICTARHSYVVSANSLDRKNHRQIHVNVHWLCLVISQYHNITPNNIIAYQFEPINVLDSYVHIIIIYALHHLHTTMTCVLTRRRERWECRCFTKSINSSGRRARNKHQ